MRRRKGHPAAAHLVHAFDSPARVAATGPRTLVRGSGAYVWDSAGRKYLDALSSLWNVSVGHGRREIASAVAAQIRQLAYAPTLLGFSSEPAQQLAARIARWTPRGLDHVLFTSGGSESNESVIRLARLYWKLRGHERKTGFVALSGAYHGSTTGAATLTGLEKFHRHFEPLMPGVERIPRAHCHGCELGLSFPDCQLACADRLEETIEGVGAERIAAFIAEPIQGVGGVIIPPAGYFERIREICDRHRILMVVDEVITGFGRTGKRFGIQHWNAVPDMLVFAKGVSSGYIPLGGVVLGDALYEALVDAGEDFALSHGYTYSGHPVACAAGLATLDILDKEKLIGRAARVGRRMARQLEKLRRHAIVSDVRSIGMMAAIEFSRTEADRAGGQRLPAPASPAERVRDAVLDRGIIIRASGDVVAMCPPLITAEEDIDRMVGAVDQAVGELSDRP